MNTCRGIKSLSGQKMQNKLDQLIFYMDLIENFFKFFGKTFNNQTKLEITNFMRVYVKEKNDGKLLNQVNQLLKNIDFRNVHLRNFIIFTVKTYCL